MKVISNFKDYYDGMMAYDNEPDSVYRRFTEIFEYDFRKPRSKKLSTQDSLHDAWLSILDTTKYRTINQVGREIFYVPDLWPAATSEFETLQRLNDPAYYHYAAPLPFAQAFRVLFCGRLYSGHRLTDMTASGKILKSHVYTFEQYVNALRSQVESTDTPDSFQIKEKALLLKAIDNGDTSNLRYPNRINLNEVNHTVLSRPCKVAQATAFNAPVVMRFGNDLTVTYEINPRLKDIDFAKAVDPAQAWQSISQYLANELADKKKIEPRPISDELRAETHGFDKSSFRKSKTGRPKLDRTNW